MWKFINSPIVITLLLLTGAFYYQQATQKSIAKEIRGAYEELLSISHDAQNELEKRKAIEMFVTEAAKQVRSGFESMSDGIQDKKKAKENRKYFDLKKQIAVEGPNIIEKNKFNQRGVVYKITNRSDEYLNKVAHTIEFYSSGTLVSVDEEWGNIKLAPGESKSYSENLGELVFDEAKVIVYDVGTMDVSEN